LISIALITNPFIVRNTQPMETAQSRSIPRRILLSVLPVLILGLTGCGKGSASLPPEQVLPHAREQMQTFNFDLARNVLRQHASDFPVGHPDRPDFLYLQALAFWHVVPPVPNDVIRAAGLLEEMVDQYPGHELRPQALIYLGRIHDMRNFAGDEPDYDKARAAYQRFLTDHPDHELVGDAVLRLAMTHIKQVQQPEEMMKGVEILQTWHENNPDSVYASLFALFLGNMYDQYLSNREMALHFYLQAYEIGFINPGRAGINTWRLVELAVERGLEIAGGSVDGGFSVWDLSHVDEKHLQISIQASQRIITDYPRSGRGYEAVLLLRRIREARPELEFEIPELQLFDFIRAEEQDA
jgi:outer membrane protein assembly factor BamD (BamD/ComL family)